MLPSIRQLHSSARSDFPKDFVAPTSQSAIAARRIALAGLRRRLAVAKLSITPNEEDAAPSERRRRANPHRRHELTIAAARRLAFARLDEAAAHGSVDIAGRTFDKEND
jgi:hypothetical protein